MEPEGELQVESSSLGSTVDQQSSHEQTHGESEESLPVSLGKPASTKKQLLKSKTIFQAAVGTLNEDDEDDNPPSKKRRRENQHLDEGKKPCSVFQQKKKNKNKTLSETDIQDSMPVLNSAPSSPDNSLKPEMADVRIPSEESQHSEANQSPSTGDNIGQIKNSSCCAYQCQEVVDQRGIEAQSEQNNRNGAAVQHADTAAKGEKMEEENSRKVDTADEQMDPSKKQCIPNSTVPDQLLGDTPNISVASVIHPVSEGDAWNKSSALNSNVASSENKSVETSTGDQSRGMKKPVPESERGRSNKREVKAAAKQGRSASISKKAKLEVDQGQNVHEEEEKAVPPVQESEGKRVSANRNQRQQPRNQKATNMQERNTEIPTVKESWIHSENNITVHFHAILSKDFSINPEKHKVVIMAEGISGYMNWQDHVCELHFIKEIKSHGHLIEGCTKIPKDNLDKPIPYKYVVVCGEHKSHEFIYKKSCTGGVVNRSLFLKSDLMSGTDWHQYDDIICAKPTKSILKTIKDNLLWWKDSEVNIMKGKPIAAKIMLENLFSILSPWTPSNIRSFLQQFHQFYWVNRTPMVHEEKRMKWEVPEFGEKQLQTVVLDYLMELSRQYEDSRSEYDKTSLALIALILVNKYNLQLSKGGLARLCVFLCLGKPPADAVNEAKYFRDLFSGIPCVEGDLIMLCNNCVEEEIQQWVWTLPVLHLFSTALDSDCNIQICLESEETWASLEGIQYAEFRENKKYHNKDLLSQIKKKHLLKRSRALFRSWFTLLPLSDLVELISDSSADPLDCLLGSFHRLKNLTINMMNSEDIIKLLEKILHILLDKQNDSVQEHTWTSCVTVCQQLHAILSSKIDNVKQYNLLATAVEIVATVLGSSECSRGGSPEDRTFQNVCKTTRDCFCRILPTNLLKKMSTSVKTSVKFHCPEEPEVWDRFLKIKFSNKNNSEDWKEALIKDLNGRIKKEGAIEQIKAYCSCYEELEKIDSVILKTFENCAIDAVDSAYQKQNNLLDLISSYDLNKLSKLKSAAIVKSWPKSEMKKPLTDPECVLKHLLEWQDSKHIFTFTGRDENILKQFTDEARELMAIAERSLKTVAGELVTGHILIKHLELIIKNKSQFLKCMEHSLPNQTPERPILTKALNLRQQELLRVKREKKCVGVLLDMLRRVQCFIQVDFTEMRQKYIINLVLETLDDVVNVRDPSSFRDDEIETYFHLNPDIKRIITFVDYFKESYIFQHCWQWAAKRLMDCTEVEENVTTLSMEDVPDFIFEPCYKEFQRLYHSLKSGELTFAEVNDLFKDFINRAKEYKELKRDFQVMCELEPQDNGEWVDERIQQIQQYYELDLALDSAKVIDEIKDILKLSGNFSVLQQLLNLTTEFHSFEQEKLSSMSPSLMHAKKLLQDITEERRGCLQELVLRTDFVNWVKEALEDINELKVFVDLASISAGENDMDVDRVACFHDAVQGYSSLLYELKREAGFEEFMECLKKLWKALESDHNLPQKLTDSARYLEWLKTIKESHGSVELSSISLATTINSKGIYRIKAPAEGEKISLDAILDLAVNESHNGQEEIRRYSLEELRELMNKLMLMSGKVEQSAEVEKFCEVFSNVQRLAASFMDLYSAGNLLFRYWIAHIYCSPKNPFCIKMDFKLNSVNGFFGNGEVTEVLPAICRKMESFLEKWNHFMSEKRSQYFYLNYYMAEQLVYLCKELGSGDPSESALMMLSFIKHNCNKQDIEEVFSINTSVVSKKPKRSLGALFGLEANRKKLTEELEQTWKSYMKNMDLFLPECLDIETLGKFLSTLANLEKRRIVRKLPEGLHAGQPNLILCPRSEVLVSTLAVYMNSPEEMLPSYDEVLLCTPQTSFEQVELIMRRCLTPGCKEKKIYTLLFADELSYDVGFRAEELFQSLCSKYMDGYHLVMFCNCEREHCYIPSVFSKFKIHMIPRQPLKDIQSYLGKHYKSQQPGYPSVSVFKDDMCVGIVSSKRAGVGKSLYIKRLHQKMEMVLQGPKVLLRTIRLIEPRVNEGKILKSLLPFLDQKSKKQPMIFHFDITSSVQTGVSEFLFKLLVLQYLEDTDGKIWLRKQCHLYVVEILEASPSPKKHTKSVFPGLNYNFLDVFPKITCRSPKEVLEIDALKNLPHGSKDPGVDEGIFRNEVFQRPFQYLIRDSRGENLDRFQYKEGSVEGSPGQCLQVFLIHCGMIDPSWSELRNFVWILNLQLKNCETSAFCNADFVQDTLQGFKNFVVKFMILMAKDFATPSLNISDESPGMQFFDLEGVTEESLAPFLLRKKWETEPHPYIFFNEDCVTMTFIGFHLQPNTYGGIDAINPLNGNIIKSNVMTALLYQGLVLQRVPFNINFDALPRAEKIQNLCMVLGIQWPVDPDETYELTTDNILKILAIEMRFRCGIPVVLMGETGCGKTRLIKYLCELRRTGIDADNMKLVKVHGGTTADAIYAKVKEAEALAMNNKLEHQFDTILFFDEANTTEAVSSIKEVLCDGTIEGQPLLPNSGLQIIAACNPYRKHTQKMIQRLESAGLGYCVKAEETVDKLGSIPLRQLVYRVHALPPSMIPLVWDFGQLNNITEKLYIQQIVQRLTRSIEMTPTEIKIVIEVLFESQTYMRQKKDECSFISLRDVERCVEVFKWFHGHSELLLDYLEKYLARKPTKNVIQRDNIIWCLVLSVSVCYHASLEHKEPYWRVISKILPEPFHNGKTVLEEISLIQDLFLSGVPLRQRIAKNMALKENVFMMVICIELKIPLFLIGKPGSSKSLAKTIVADAMQGQAAYSDLYKELKQIHLVSFQCSPHSTPEGIISTFKHCARFQEGKDLKEYVSVVVLDEIGLAEDSPKMPLKTLHPLLEDGCVDDDPLPHKKVGFIGISNWALDPAKMNRGIFVSRGDPNNNELIESAKGICSEHLVLQKVERFFPIFANAYEEICKTQNKEFFGLRDYYSLIKMVFALTRKSECVPGPHEIAEVVLRNFSGKDGVEALDIFMSKIPEKGDENYKDISTIDLIQKNIYSDYQDGECRYLLVLTENYAALQILQQCFFKDIQPEIIFGSSFPKDQEYTQICRNINRVKICMETGQMVILLNLQNLYESLYDALNQYYVQLAGQKYVDLGLGTHRVKCRVHSEFRLIVIEEKEVVYKQFPIPLINRLEKHYLDINTVLDKYQKSIVEDLKKWVKDFTAVKAEKYFMGQQNYTPSDVFIGYHSDTCASVVLQVTEKLKTRVHPEQLKQEIQEQAKQVLLNCATPDSVVRLGDSQLGSFLGDFLATIYFQQQQHISFADFLNRCLSSESRDHTVFIEITTFSRLLTATDAEILEAEMQHNTSSLKVLFLQQFDTEYSFLKDVRNYLGGSTFGSKILIIQTDFESGSLSAHLTASAKYSVVNEINKVEQSKATVYVFFITKLSRVEGGSSYVGFHGGLWQSVHIDDLRRSKDMVSDITSLRSITISQLFSADMGESAENPVLENFHETSAVTKEMGEMEEEMEVEMSPTPKQKILTKILDTTVLLRSCVQSAVGMLRDQNEDAGRSTKRIEILLRLLSEEDDLKVCFLKIVKSRLSNLLKKQEDIFFSVKDWVIREALNLTALQEAGTFRRTLWKRVQDAVIPFLAHIVSVLDRDYNLDLLVQPSTENCVKDLWMFIFNDPKLLDITYMMGKSSSETKKIQVPNYIDVSVDGGNRMPFSWRIKDYLEDLRVQAQHISNNDDHAKKFVDIFQMTPLGQHIARFSEEERAILFHCYVRDFILLTMNVTSCRELNVLQTAFLSCIEEMKAASFNLEAGVLPLPWIHLGYHQFRRRLQNFCRILAVYPDVLNVLEELEKKGSCIWQQMVLDVHAALACTEMLSETILKCKIQAWLQQVKNLQMPIELVCTTTTNCIQSSGSQCNLMLQEIKRQWNRIFSMSLFVEHVLLGAERLIPELQNLVKKWVLQLGKCFEDSDIKTRETFTAVMRVLCQCKEEASQIFCRFGLNSCPICLGDPGDPVKLPCDHIFCFDCIKQYLVLGEMFCPFCRVSLPEDYSPTVSEELRIVIQKNTQFRKLCNSFFIDLITTMCFKDNNPPEKAVIEELLNMMFVHKNILKGPESVHTKSLSPFDDVVDKTPVIRSVVLKLLLKYSFSDVKVYVREHLSQVEANRLIDKEDKIELYTIFVNCFEDSMCERSGLFSKETKTSCLAKDEHFLRNYFQRKNSSQEISQELTIEYLQGVANIRLCMDRAAELLFELHETPDNNKERGKQHYLNEVMQFCCRTQNNWYRIYLVRKLTNEYGLEFTQKLLNDHQYHWVFPPEIIQQQKHELSRIDRFLVCGKNYKAVRDAVGTAMIECQAEVVAAALKEYKGSKSTEAAHFLLALFRELTSLYGCQDPSVHPKQKQCDVLKEFIQKFKGFPSPQLETFAESLVANDLPILTLSPKALGHSVAVTEMVVHSAVVLLCGQNQILEPLRNLAFSPRTMQNAFLPTMPEDMLAQAVKWAGMDRVLWYTCPNGHPCVIGECGRPMQQGLCVDCGAQIGGVNHIPLPNFHQTRVTQDRTQTGHILGDPSKMETAVAFDREIPPAAFILIRLLTHLALLLGASNDAQSLLQIIKPQVQDPVSFFLQHMHKDVEQLMNTLGKSADETTNVVHLVLCSLLKDQHEGLWPVQFDSRLSTKQARNKWEKIVARAVVLPELKHLDKTLLDLNRQISEDERISSNPVVKIIYGDPAVFLSQLPTDSAIHSSKMWSCRKRITVEHLAHIVQQKGGKETVPFLWKFLQKEGELRLVKFLPEILALQKDLVKRFQNYLDVEHCTIEYVLNGFPSGGVLLLMKDRVEKFLAVWNKLRSSIGTNGEIKLPEEYCSRDLTVKDEFEILLPRRRGLGLCATALVSYLIQLHNEFINTIVNDTADNNRYSVSPAEVADLHMISYEVEKDLIPLILSNCQYSMEKGGEALQEFDLDKIQQQLISRFLQGKPKITMKGVPTLVYRYDQNYEHLFSDIRRKLDQRSLLNSTIAMISGELVSYSDICEALSVTEIILGFLAMSGGDSRMTLSEYIEKVLQMGSQTSPPVLKALSRCSLDHTIALWQLLSSHKSEHLLHLKQDPFAEVNESYKEELTPENTRNLNTFLMQAGLESFLQELHEMIILKVKQAKAEDKFKPEWSLKDMLFLYLEGKGSDAFEELEDMFPEDIQMSQCIASWKMAATLKRDRRFS